MKQTAAEKFQLELAKLLADYESAIRSESIKRGLQRKKQNADKRD